MRNFPKQILVLVKEKIDLSKESFYPLRSEFLQADNLTT